MDFAGLDRWLNDYGKAWEAADPDAAAALFSEDASYQETPFDEPMIGLDAIRAYWSREVVERQRDIEFGWESLVAAEIAVARWWASFTRVASGRRDKLDGVFLLRFEGDRCSELREWWHIAVGTDR